MSIGQSRVNPGRIRGAIGNCRAFGATARPATATTGRGVAGLHYGGGAVFAVTKAMLSLGRGVGGGAHFLGRLSRHEDSAIGRELVRADQLSR